MQSRSELPAVFSTLTGIGAEIGVLRGDFSRLIAKSYGGKLLLVDRQVTPEIQGLADDDPGKFLLMHGSSVDVAATIDNESLDWVYIDAGHTYEDVKADLAAWIPKVRIGGIIAGHDYFDGNWDGVEFGVKKAVDELGENVQVTTDDFYGGHPFQSWWFIKL